MFALDLVPIRPSLKKFEPFIDQCIYFALEGDAKILILRLQKWGREDSWQYKFPQVFLCSKSLNVLVLASCKLESPRRVWLPSLRELHMSEVNADDQVIKNLVAGCPLIEVLCIRTRGGFKSLELIGHSNKLNESRVFDNKELKRVVIKGEIVHSIVIEVPFVPCEINVASCKNLKSLKISRASFIADEWLCNHISNCPLLESLTIDPCPRFTSVKISSLHLKQFCIMDCESLAEVQIETPNLRIFKYSGSIISFISDALTLSEADLCFISDDVDTQWYVKYVELLARFHCFSKLLKLRSFLGEFKFSYKKPLVYEGGIAQCCKSRIISCWQQWMEEVETEYCTGKQYEDGNYSVPGKDVKRYTVKGEYIWEKIVSLTEFSTPLDDY